MMVMMMVMKRGSRVRTDQVHKRTKEDGCLRTMRGGNNDEKKITIIIIIMINM